MNNREIAAFLRECAARAPVEPSTSLATFLVPGTTLKVTCRYSRDHIRNCADRFERGLPRQGRTFVNPGAYRSTGTFKPSEAAFLSFWNDGERDNAMEYLRNFPRDTWPARVLAALGETA